MLDRKTSRNCWSFLLSSLLSPPFVLAGLPTVFALNHYWQVWFPQPLASMIRLFSFAYLIVNDVFVIVCAILNL
jgi:hypothetical protein